VTKGVYFSFARGKAESCLKDLKRQKLIKPKASFIRTEPEAELRSNQGARDVGSLLPRAAQRIHGRSRPGHFGPDNGPFSVLPLDVDHAVANLVPGLVNIPAAVKGHENDLVQCCADFFGIQGANPLHRHDIGQDLGACLGRVIPWNLLICGMGLKFISDIWRQKITPSLATPLVSRIYSPPGVDEVGISSRHQETERIKRACRNEATKVDPWAGMSWLRSGQASDVSCLECP